MLTKSALLTANQNKPDYPRITYLNQLAAHEWNYNALSIINNNTWAQNEMAFDLTIHRIDNVTNLINSYTTKMTNDVIDQVDSSYHGINGYTECRTNLIGWHIIKSLAPVGNSTNPFPAQPNCTIPKLPLRNGTLSSRRLEELNSFDITYFQWESVSVIDRIHETNVKLNEMEISLSHDLKHIGLAIAEMQKALDIEVGTDGKDAKSSKKPKTKNEKNIFTRKLLETGMTDGSTCDIKESVEELKIIEEEVTAGVESVKNEVKAIKSNSMAMEGKVESVEGEVESIKGKVESIEGKVGSMEGKIESMESKVESIESKVESIEGKVESMEKTMEEVKDMLSQLIMRGADVA